MANAAISKFTANSTQYDIKPIAVHYAAGTGTTAVTSSPYTFSKWEASIPAITELYDGLIIAYKVPVAGNGSYGTCLQVNSLGYHPVCTTVNSHISTRYAVNATLLLIYNSSISASVYNNSASAASIAGCWMVVNDYDSGNTVSQLRTENGRIYAGDTGIKPYSICALDAEGTWSTLITGNSTTGNVTTHTINTSGKYALPAEFVYYSANNTAAANALVSSTYNVFSAHQAVDIRYSHNYTTTFTTNKVIWLECTISNGTWSPTTTCLTQTLTSGKYYIFMGVAYSTAYQLSLFTYHPCYYYDGTNLIDYRAHLSIDNLSVSGKTITYTRGDGTTGTITTQDTDTHHTAYIRAGASGGTANAATTSGNTFINLVENGANRSGVKLVPGSNMSITSDASGNITFAATDTNTDTKVTNTLGTTTKYYLTGTTSAATNTGTQTFDSGIYSTTTAGQLNATTYKVNEQVTLQWNTTDESLDFVFA